MNGLRDDLGPRGVCFWREDELAFLSRIAQSSVDIRRGTDVIDLCVDY